MSSITLPKFQIEQRGCYLIDMNPPRKSKPGKVRPVIVIQSTDTIEAGSPGIVIVPLTTQNQDENILRVAIKPTAQLQLSKKSDCLVDQIHTVDRSLFLEEIGFVSEEVFVKIQDGVRFLLSLNSVEGAP